MQHTKKHVTVLQLKVSEQRFETN